MRKRVLFYLCSVILLFGLISCSKEGPEGPLGPRGERGEKGERGEVGAKGADGTLLRYGNGVPASSLGNEGDFYIDMKGNVLYGPKALGWGTGSNIKGDKGDAGATGAKGDKGDKGDTGAKGDKGDTGAKGDKGDTGATGATGAPGAKGDKGDTGAKGDKGDTGATGTKGQDGSQFLSGTAVPSSQGKVGDFYFHTSTATLYGPKSSSGWGAGVSLKGPKGDKGDKGDTGNANVRSSGWRTVESSKWSNFGGYRSPLDIATPFSTNSFFPSAGGIDGVVLVYVMGLKGLRPTEIMQLPVMNNVTGGGKTGGVELRFNYSGDPDFAQWLDLSIGLQTGAWDLDYIKNTYLPSLKWKVVIIPASFVSSYERALSKIDLKDYEQVKAFFNLKD